MIEVPAFEEPVPELVVLYGDIALHLSPEEYHLLHLAAYDDQEAARRLAEKYAAEQEPVRAGIRSA